MGQLTASDKANILAWKEHHVSQGVMAERIGCSRKAVNQFLKRWKEEESTGRKPGSGRPSKKDAVSTS